MTKESLSRNSEESTIFQESDLEQLNFEELRVIAKKIKSLAFCSFKQTENGFENALGDVISIKQRDGKFVLREVFSSLRDIHTFLATHSESVLVRGSADSEEMMRAIRSMLEELNNRIIN